MKSPRDVLGPLAGKDRGRPRHTHLHRSLSGLFRVLSLPRCLSHSFFFLRWLLFPRIGMFPRWCRRRASDNAWLTSQELSNRKGMLGLFCQHRHIGPERILVPRFFPGPIPAASGFRSCDQPDLLPVPLSVAGVGERREKGLQGTRIEESCRTLWNVGGVVQRS